MEPKGHDGCCEGGECRRGERRCVACEHGMDKVRETEEKAMEEYGWYAHLVMPSGEGEPANYHTHGLKETFGHHDLQITAPIDPMVAAQALTKIAQQVAGGSRFKSGKSYDFELGEWQLICTFVKGKEGGREVLRVILPDHDGEQWKETYS